MTDKQIIIDGIDVSRCAERSMCINCETVTNCYYKRLKRKEQECYEYSKELGRFQQEVVPKLRKRLRNKEQECETLEKALKLQKGFLEHTEKECEELKKNYFTIIQQRNKAEKTLGKIKAEMHKILMVGNGINDKYRPVKNSSKQDCYQVLGKIQEILGTNQIKISEVDNANI